MKRFFAIILILLAGLAVGQTFPTYTDGLDSTAARPLDRRWLVIVGGVGIDGMYHAALMDSSGALLSSAIALDPATYEADTVTATYSTEDSTIYFTSQKDFVMISARESWDYAVGFADTANQYIPGGTVMNIWAPIDSVKVRCLESGRSSIISVIGYRRKTY